MTVNIQNPHLKTERWVGWQTHSKGFHKRRRNSNPRQSVPREEIDSFGCDQRDDFESLMAAVDLIQLLDSTFLKPGGLIETEKKQLIDLEGLDDWSGWEQIFKVESKRSRRRLRIQTIEQKVRLEDSNRFYFFDQTLFFFYSLKWFKLNLFVHLLIDGRAAGRERGIPLKSHQSSPQITHIIWFSQNRWWGSAKTRWRGSKLIFPLSRSHLKTVVVFEKFLPLQNITSRSIGDPIL